MKALLMSVERQKAEFVDAPWDFEELYKLINCQTIELAYRTLDGKEFMFALDEEGLFVENQRISAVDRAMKPMFVGSYVVFGLDEDNNPRYLTQEEQEILIKHVSYVGTRMYPHGLLMLKDLQIAE